MKIFIEQHPNTEIRTFHVSENFANREYVSLGRSYYSEPKNPYSKRLVAFASRLSKLKETQEIGVQKNNVRVTRNMAFSWDEINPVIVAAIEKYFGCEAIVEEQPREAWMDKPMRDSDY